MDSKELEGKKIADLREIAKTAGIENADKLKKSEIIEQLTAKQTSNEDSDDDNKSKRPRKRIKVVDENKEEQGSLFKDDDRSKESISPEKPQKEPSSSEKTPVDKPASEQKSSDKNEADDDKRSSFSRRGNRNHEWT